MIYNNTVSGCTIGITSFNSDGSSIVRYFNNVCDGNTTDFSGSFSNPTTGTNCSSDTSSPDGASFRSLTFTFESGTDFHLASGDTGASGKGTDLSSDTYYPFSVDIDGDTRSAWDAGADEKAVGTSIPIFQGPFGGPFAGPL
jgi:hypothetical protein